MNKRLKYFLIFLSLAALFIPVLFNFCVVGKYVAYPWWHEFDHNDTDAVNSEIAFGLASGIQFICPTHPGATILSIHGAAFRLLSCFSDPYKKFYQLPGIRSMDEFSNILNLSTRTSRVLNFIQSLLFIVLAYTFVYQLTNNLLATFLACFYLFTTFGFLRHTQVVRPEMPSLFFFFGALLMTLPLFKKNLRLWPTRILLFVAIGLLLGLSVFSKVQAGLLVIIYILFMCACFLFRPQALDTGPSTGRLPLVGMILCALNLLIFPWWAIQRPPWINPSSLKMLIINLKDLYGPAPASFIPTILGPLFCLFLLSITLFSLNHLSFKFKAYKVIQRLSLFVNAVITGAIASCYLTFLPAESTLAGYIADTRNTIYGMLCTLSFGGVATKKPFEFDIFCQTVGKMHANNSLILGLPLVYFLLALTAILLVRLSLQSTRNKPGFALALFFIFTGLAMDMFSTFRLRGTVQDYYAIYSLAFYAPAMAQWLSCEWQQKFNHKKKWSLAASYIMAGILIMQIPYKSYVLWNTPRASGKTDQSPNNELLNIQSWTPELWKAVEKSIREKNNGVLR